MSSKSIVTLTGASSPERHTRGLSLPSIWSNHLALQVHTTHHCDIFLLKSRTGQLLSVCISLQFCNIAVTGDNVLTIKIISMKLDLVLKVMFH